jgi:hypothetical protein
MRVTLVARNMNIVTIQMTYLLAQLHVDGSQLLQRGGEGGAEGQAREGSHQGRGQANVQQAFIHQSLAQQPAQGAEACGHLILLDGCRLGGCGLGGCRGFLGLGRCRGFLRAREEAERRALQPRGAPERPGSGMHLLRHYDKELGGRTRACARLILVLHLQQRPSALGALVHHLVGRGEELGARDADF